MLKAAMQSLAVATLLAVATFWIYILALGSLYDPRMYIQWGIPLLALWVVAAFIESALLAAVMWMANTLTILVSKASRHGRVEEPYFSGNKWLWVAVFALAILSAIF